MSSRLLVYSALSASMPFQMALDELLFEQMIQASQAEPAVSRAALRFYYASEPWISIGYSHAGWKALSEGLEVSADLLSDAARYPVCRRITGGGRVLHGKDLMVTLIAPRALDESFKSVMGSYARLHEVLVEALRAVGIEARFYREEDSLPLGKDCFLHPIASDLEADGKKIAGGGQKRSRGFLLHQESIHLEQTHLYEPLARAFAEGLEKWFGCKPEKADWQPEHLEAAEILGREKYAVHAPVKK